MTMPLSLLAGPSIAKGGIPPINGGDARSGAYGGTADQYLARNAPFVVSGQGGRASAAGGLTASQGPAGGSDGLIWILIGGFALVGALVALK